MIILPGDPDFDWTLACAIPPDWQDVADRIGEQIAFVCSPGSGLLRPATDNELTDYLYGGEYDERLQEIGDFYELG